MQRKMILWLAKRPINRFIGLKAIHLMDCNYVWLPILLAKPTIIVFEFAAVHLFYGHANGAGTRNCFNLLQLLLMAGKGSAEEEGVSCLSETHDRTAANGVNKSITGT